MLEGHQPPNAPIGFSW